MHAIDTWLKTYLLPRLLQKAKCAKHTMIHGFFWLLCFLEVIFSINEIKCILKEERKMNQRDFNNDQNLKDIF